MNPTFLYRVYKNSPLVFILNPINSDYITHSGSTVLARTLAASHQRFYSLINISVGLLWMSDQPVAKASTYTRQQNTGTQKQTAMTRAGFERTSPVTKQLRPTS
jgi:hypothetical protein